MKAKSQFDLKSTNSSVAQNIKDARTAFNENQENSNGYLSRVADNSPQVRQLKSLESIMSNSVIQRSSKDNEMVLEEESEDELPNRAKVEHFEVLWEDLEVNKNAGVGDKCFGGYFDVYVLLEDSETNSPNHAVYMQDAGDGIYIKEEGNDNPTIDESADMEDDDYYVLAGEGTAEDNEITTEDSPGQYYPNDGWENGFPGDKSYVSYSFEVKQYVKDTARNKVLAYMPTQRISILGTWPDTMFVTAKPTPEPTYTQDND